ncbi:MAG TPA: hypothetical protein VFJ98_03100 [Mycobacteriales bacterium]|nr:hypothetical protein [Mycobacteriales bacterium]
MSIASPAIRASRRPLVREPRGLLDTDPDQLRDELTRDRLRAAVDHLPGLTVEGYDPQWWDGQAHVACLVVRGGRRMRRLRVVETEGECVVVPFSRRVAQRWLAARRRPRRAELDHTALRRGDAVVIDGWTDAVRCPTRGCAALRPLDYPGCCPLCGD